MVAPEQEYLEEINRANFMDKNMPDKGNVGYGWEVLEEKDLLVIAPRLKVSKQRLKLPSGKIINDYYQIGLPEAVLMVASTARGKIVMSRQYMHGFRRVSLVLPAGTIEEGESPLETAKRELMEETGYTSGEWRLLASLSPHANYGCGKVHFFSVVNARLTVKPSAVDFEEMEIVLLDERQIIKAIRNGEIISVGTITALALAKVILGGRIF